MKSFTLSVFFIFQAFFLCAQDSDIINHAPGILVNAGGHKLHLNVIGHGHPAVIMENGSGDFSFIWDLVQPEVARFTETVSYDRAGYAWSDPGPLPRTGKQITWELHTALHNAGIKPPYILVGQSFGGFLVRYFALYYPKEVAGMVLVEAVQEDQAIFMGGDVPKKIRETALGRTAPPLKTYFRPLPDTSRVANKINSDIDPLFDKFPDSIKQWQIWAQSQPDFIQSVQSEMDWSPEDVKALYDHRKEKKYTLRNLPLIVLTRAKGGFEGRADSLVLEKERLKAQHNLISLSVNSKQIIDPNSGHNIHVDDPKLVIQSIREVFLAAKNHSSLTSTTSSVRQQNHKNPGQLH